MHNLNSTTKNQNTELHNILCRFSTYNKTTNTSYTRHVKIIQTQNTEQGKIYNFYCKQFDFNDTRITSLVRQVAYAFDILILQINADGKLVDVNNQQQLQAKWEKTKSNLQKNNTGFAFENYINSVDKVLYNLTELLEFIQSNTMYGLFLDYLKFEDTNDKSQYRVLETKSRKKYRLQLDNNIKEQLVLTNDTILLEYTKYDTTMQHEMIWIG